MFLHTVGRLYGYDKRKVLPVLYRYNLTVYILVTTKNQVGPNTMAPIARSAVANATPEAIWKACFEHMKFEMWDPDVTEVGPALLRQYFGTITCAE